MGIEFSWQVISAPTVKARYVSLHPSLPMRTCLMTFQKVAAPTVDTVHTPPLVAPSVSIQDTGSPVPTFPSPVASSPWDLISSPNSANYNYFMHDFDSFQPTATSPVDLISPPTINAFTFNEDFPISKAPFTPFPSDTVVPIVDSSSLDMLFSSSGKVIMID